MNLAEYFKKQIFYEDMKFTKTQGIAVFEETTKTFFSLEEFIADKIANGIINLSNYEITHRTINGNFLQITVK